MRFGQLYTCPRPPWSHWKGSRKEEKKSRTLPGTWHLPFPYPTSDFLLCLPFLPHIFFFLPEPHSFCVFNLHPPPHKSITSLTLHTRHFSPPCLTFSYPSTPLLTPSLSTHLSWYLRFAPLEHSFSSFLSLFTAACLFHPLIFLYHLSSLIFLLYVPALFLQLAYFLHIVSSKIPFLTFIILTSVNLLLRLPDVFFFYLHSIHLYLFSLST